MILFVRYRTVFFFAASLFLFLFSFFGSLQVKAQEETGQLVEIEKGQGAEKEITQAQSNFPGRSEIVPRATLTAAKMAETRARVQKAEPRAPVNKTLDLVKQKLGQLEERYNDWEEIKTWRLNRLRMAESAYSDLDEKQKDQLGVIQSQLEIMEKLQDTWEREKTYWQTWQGNLNEKNVAYPEEVFVHILESIDRLLELIARVNDELIKEQQKYSPAQVIITSRLISINKTLNIIRQETLRRNSYSLFEPRFYSQFNRGLFADFLTNLEINLRAPKGFFKDRGWAVVLQVFVILIITRLLINHRRRRKSIAEEWHFLFRRPLAGAIFINLIVIGNFTNFYQMLPVGWRWILIIIVTTVTLRLINVLIKESVEKRAVKIIAAIFIVTESLQTFGVPEPLLQLYDVLLCTIVIFYCWPLIRQEDERLSKLRFLMYLVLGVAFIALTTAMFGFERFASRVVLAMLSTLILLVIIRIALRMISEGIKFLMQLKWMRDRTFMQVLGLEEATRKLQILFRIIILINAALTLLVMWGAFEHVRDARNAILGYEFTFGELTLSVHMVILLVVILYLTSLLSWMIQAFADSQIMTPRKMELGIKESLKRLIHYGLFTIGFLIAVSTAGLELQKLTILAGALGVGIGFGLQNIVNNFVSGLILLFERPVKVGDIININQDWGTITKIGLRSTVFETFDNSEIIVPNSDLVAQKVTNWTFTTKMVRIVLPVGVAYGSPLEKVLEILNKAAREHSQVLSNPAPDSIFEGFGNSSIDFQLRFWVRSINDRLRIRTEVAVIIDRLFRAEGIVIAFPQLDLHLRSIDSDLQTQWAEKSLKNQTGKEEAPE